MKVTNLISPYLHSFGSEEAPMKYGSFQESFPYSTSGLWFPPHMNQDLQGVSKSDIENRTPLDFSGYAKPRLDSNRFDQIRTDVQGQLEEGKPAQLDVWVSTLDKRTNSPKSYEKGLKKCSSTDASAVLDQLEAVSADIRHCDEYKFPNTLYIFRSGISPIWQDQANIKGGRFTLVLSFPFKNESFKKFNDLVQVLSLFHSTPKSVKAVQAAQDTLNFLTEKNIVSKERALFRREVVGVSLKFQDSVNILSVWNKFAFNPNKLSSLTFVLSKLLGVSSARLRYRSHQESSGTTPTPENVVNGVLKPVIPPLQIPPQNNSKVLATSKKQPIPPQKITKKRRQTQPGADTDLADPQPESDFNQKFGQSLSTPVSPHFSNFSPFPPVNYLTPNNANPWSFWSEEPRETVESPAPKRKNSEELPEIDDSEAEQDEEILYLYEYYSTLAQQEKKKRLNKKSSNSDVNFLSLITSISCFPMVEDKAESSEREWSNDLSSIQRVTNQQLRSRLEVLQLVENYYSISSKMSM